MTPVAAPAHHSSWEEDFRRLKELVLRQDPRLFSELRRQTRAATTCEQVLRLSSLCQRAAQKGLLPAGKPVRIAILGAYTPYPLHQVLAQYLAAGFSEPWRAEFLIGDYDSYIAEIIGDSSRLQEFKPEIVLLLPSHRLCQPPGDWFDPREQQEADVKAVAGQILDLCKVAHERTGAEIFLANFPLPGRFDPGPYRVRTLRSDWTFRKAVNLELGLSSPSFVHICDAEFLSARRGTLAAWEARAWFESKQPYGAELLMDVAREAAYMAVTLRQSPKKVAVLDLDNTLWGGVVGDDGLDGIEIGDTSPRGEAFKAFQQYLLSLTKRGVLLAVCSKNDHAKAVEPFEKHPEMALRMKDFASFQANWEPKSENIRRIAAELNLGLDSFVFIDDNPAEVDIVRQFVPEVAAVLLSDDPSESVALLQDGRYFEPKSVTPEDIGRLQQYRQEAERQQLLAGVTDMGAYLASLGMEAAIREFRAVDAPRISQLINKSNQFNLTTRRRTEAEVQEVMADPSCFAFTVRLADRFGDYGLISVIIGKVEGNTAGIDTWLMSCRVLKRQVEEEVLNEIVRLAVERGCSRVKGIYLPTAKNGMVKDHYPTLGFAAAGEGEFELETAAYQPRRTAIRITERAYDAK